jgi:predicted dinucleotide-binding enzyme
MKIAIIGSGNVGGALAIQCIKAGYDVLIGVNFPLSEKSLKLATTIGKNRLTTIKEAAKKSELIIVATPAHVILTILPELGNVENKIIVDATNAIRLKPTPYVTAFEAIKKITRNDKVVKCFNTTGFENLLDPNYHQFAIDLFAAGSNMDAKQTVMKLVLDLGFGACYDFGGDDKVELLEQFALSWINLAIMQGQGRNMAFKVLTRN